MAEKMCPGPLSTSAGFREAVCVHTKKVYDQCRSRDCMRDLRVFLPVDEQCFIIENIDATIIAQRPKMRPYIEEMRENIAKVLKLDLDRVNVKATTEEGLGFTGTGEGISSQAVCLLQPLLDLAADDRMQPDSGCRGCPGCAREGEE